MTIYNLLSTLTLPNTHVIYYPYRTARVNRILSFKCEDDSERRQYIDLIERCCMLTTAVYNVDSDTIEPISKEIYVGKDNHICFKIDTMYIMFNDYNIIVGTVLTTGRW